MRRDLIKLFAEDYLLTPPVQKRDRDKLKDQTKYLRLQTTPTGLATPLCPGTTKYFHYHS